MTNLLVSIVLFDVFSGDILDEHMAIFGFRGMATVAAVFALCLSNALFLLPNPWSKRRIRGPVGEERTIDSAEGSSSSE